MWWEALDADFMRNHTCFYVHVSEGMTVGASFDPCFVDLLLELLVFY